MKVEIWYAVDEDGGQFKIELDIQAMVINQ